MSYARPPANAADASWTSSALYTELAADSADASWVTGSAASGFLVAHVGIPSSPFQAQGTRGTEFGQPELAMSASGFCPVAFGLGEAVGVYQQDSSESVTGFGEHTFREVFSAGGFVSGIVGIPSMPLLAAGQSSTAFGDHRGYQFWQQRSLPPATKIPGAFSPSEQSSVAFGVVGSHFGLPFGLTSNAQKINWVTRAAGFRSTKSGVPSTAIDLLCSAGSAAVTYLGTPFSASSMLGVVTRFGSPRAVAVGVASGQEGAKLGQPVLRVGGRADGLKSTGVGAPTCAAGFMAHGKCSTAMGKHKCFRPDMYAAWPLQPRTAFGRPTAEQRFNHQAHGACSTAEGAPTCSLAYRAMHIPPIARFGTHLLSRGTIC